MEVLGRFDRHYLWITGFQMSIEIAPGHCGYPGNRKPPLFRRSYKYRQMTCSLMLSGLVSAKPASMVVITSLHGIYSLISTTVCCRLNNYRVGNFIDIGSGNTWTTWRFYSGPCIPDTSDQSRFVFLHFPKLTSPLLSSSHSMFTTLTLLIASSEERTYLAKRLGTPQSL